MNIKEVLLTNGISPSKFLVNISQVSLWEFHQTNPKSGMIGLHI